jgi:phage FluMu gp28-like protein
MSVPPISPELDFLLTYLDLPAATDQPDAQWEQFQFEHLNNPSLFDIITKSRRAGFSWLTAARGVARGKLKKRHTSTYVSISQEEATEKIRYAKQISEALDREVRPRLIIDNALELEFDNGSRLISHPCRPVRGKGGDVYLDEFAHYAKDREIYTSAVPVVTKGGQLSMGSTPLGAGGVFWEIYEEKIKKYPGYRRSAVPWWVTAALCRDVIEAEKLAGYMLTEERVKLFGTQRLLEIFENMTLEDFQQEYECAWIDESIAWITWDEIKQNQIEAQAGQLWFRHAKTVEEALQAIDDVAQAIKEGKAEPALSGGMDIGRKHDLTELGFVGKAATRQTPLRLMISLSRVPFEDQRAVAAKALTVLPVTGLLIDQNGLGMQLAEQLNAAFGARAQGVDFTNANKELWSVELRVRMQKGQVPIPMDRDLSYQIHSIKKSITASKNVVFDTVANEKHHADKYWMLALAVWATNIAQGDREVLYDDSIRVEIGY